MKIIIDKFVKRDGRSSLYIRGPYINGRYPANIALQIDCLPENFDPVRFQISHEEDESLMKQLVIDRAITLGRTIQQRYMLDNRPLTPEMWHAEFVAQFSGSHGKTETFIQYCTRLFSKRKFKSNSNRYNHKAFLENIEKYSDVEMYQVNEKYVEGFIAYLRGQNKKKVRPLMKESSIRNMLRVMSYYANLAKRDSLVLRNPVTALFQDIDTVEKPHYALTESELKQLFQLYEKSEKLSTTERKALKMFLFACFTGLRHSDCLQLSSSNITNNTLVKVAQKNKKQLNIPLPKIAMQLIKDVKNKELFFIQIHNYEINNILSRLFLEHLKIDRRITFHVARKTFATLYLSEHPEDFATLADLLGDTLTITIKTYARIITTTKRKRMDFFDRMK